MKRLLLVEDDTVLGQKLDELFARDGFAVQVLASFDAAWRSDIFSCDVAVVDWLLHDGEGIDLVRHWRRLRPALPIIMLTARAQTTSKLVGIELGANDYITKPFEPLELAARVRRHLSQVDACSQPPSKRVAPLEAAGIRLDLTARQVSYLGAAVTLTKLQYELLKHFLEHPGAAFSRDEILNRVWGYENYPTTRTVDNHVAQLRQLFAPTLFETLHGVGYRFLGTVVDEKSPTQ